MSFQPSKYKHDQSKLILQSSPKGSNATPKGRNRLNLEKEEITRLLSFALEKSFNQKAQTRSLRKGDDESNSRNRCQMFMDTLRGKSAEYVFLQIFKETTKGCLWADGIQSKQVDLEILSQNCDTGDFEFGFSQRLNISIKSTKTIGAHLLLEKLNYSENGEELSDPSNPKKVDFFVLFGINVNDEKVEHIVHNFKTYQEAKENLSKLVDLFLKESITFDAIGVLSRKDFQKVMAQHQYALKGEITLGKPLEVDNYLIPEKTNKLFNLAMEARILEKLRTSQTPVVCLAPPQQGLDEILAIIQDDYFTSHKNSLGLVQKNNFKF